MQMRANDNLRAETRNANALFGIFQVLKNYLSEGGSRTNALRICREALFFIYEAGNPGKYTRHSCSQAASRLRGSSGKCYDHAIPLAVWLEDVLRGDLSDFNVFHEAIQRSYHVRIITKDEHDRLHEIGLGDCMPLDWDGDDVEARYKKAGIVLLGELGSESTFDRFR